MSVYFPKELRSYFQSIETKNNQELESLFKENEAVQHAFISWAKAHQSVVAGTPYLFRAFEIANSDSLDCKISDVFDKRVIAVVSEALSTENELEEFPEGYLEHSLLLFESGIIDKSQLKKLLSRCDEIGRYPFNFQTMKKAIPILERFNFSEFRDFVSIDYGRGLILHDPSFLVKIRASMGNFTFDQLKELFSIQDDKKGAALYEGGTVLHYSRLFKEISPLLENLTSEQLAEILSIQDKDGNTPLYIRHGFNNFELLNKLNFAQLKKVFSVSNDEGKICLGYFHIFNKIYPFLKQNFDEIQLADFFSIEDRLGNTILHTPEILEEILPLLQEERFIVPAKTLFSIPNHDGDTILHFIDLLQKILPVLEKFETPQILDFLCTQNHDGGTPLHYSNALEKVLPLLMRKMDADQTQKIFSIQENDGKTLLHYPILFETALPLLKKLSQTEIVKLFSIQEQKGETPLHNFEVMKEAISFLKNFDEESFIKVFAIKNVYHKTLLHDSKVVEKALPLLIERSSASLNDLFTIQDVDGNTPLHDSLILAYAVPLFDKLKEDVWNIRNGAGSRPGEHPFLSWAWLKELTNTKNLEVLSDSEYAERATQLKQTIDKAWNSFVVGEAEGQISEQYLALEVFGKVETYSREEIKRQIDNILDKIVAKTAWRGTPRAEETEKLRVFYSQMLRDFENLVSYFKSENLKAQVGFLIGIAKAEMEVRCALAYQEEIAQAGLMLKLDSVVDSKPLLSQAELVFSSHAETCLLALIEDIARNDYEGNSHATNQMRFSLGLSLAEDPDAMITPEDCREIIFNDSKIIEYISKFKESFNASEKEFLEEWLCAMTPKTFGEEYFEIQREIEDKEKIIIENSEKVLISITSNEVIEESKDIIEESEDIKKNKASEKLIQAFQSPQWGALKLPPLQKKDLDEAMFNQLSKALTLQDIEEVEAMHYENGAANRAKMIKLQDTITTSKKLENSWDEKQKAEYEELLKAKQTLQTSIMNHKREFIEMKSVAVRRVELKYLVDKLGLLISIEDFEKILDEKRNFDGNMLKLAKKMLKLPNKMLKLANKKEINFKAAENGLPSKAVERARRQAYAAQFLDEEGLNEEGAIYILKKYQVLLSVR